MMSPIRRAMAGRSSLPMVSIAPSAAAQATGFPPNVPPRPPACTASIISARPVTPASGSPPAMPLAVVIRSGTTPSWSTANQLPVRQNPDWISSATNTIPLARQYAARPGRNPSGGTTKPPSPWIGSITTAATFFSPTCAWIRPVTTSSASAWQAAGPPERVGHGHPVDVGGERPEPVLVGHVLGRHRHRQVGAAVVGVVEHHDRRAPGRVPRDLDRVLDGLSPGVEQRGPLVEVARSDPVELLADLHVTPVGRDHEAGVREPRHLLGDPLHDQFGAVADRGHGDPG